MLDVVIVRVKSLSTGATSVVTSEYAFAHHVVEMFRDCGHGHELDRVWDVLAFLPGAATRALYGWCSLLGRRGWGIQPTSILVTDEVLAFVW